MFNDYYLNMSVNNIAKISNYVNTIGIKYKNMLSYRYIIKNY